MSLANPPSRIRDRLAQILVSVSGALLVAWILLGVFLIVLPGAPQEGLSKFETWSYQQRAHAAVEEAHPASGRKRPATTFSWPCLYRGSHPPKKTPQNPRKTMRAQDGA